VELLVASTLGALLLLATAGSAGLFGRQVEYLQQQADLSVDRPGWGRTPPDWPDSLQLTGWVIATLAFPRVDATGLEELSIKAYAFSRN
jgi:hypothetical protein